MPHPSRPFTAVLIATDPGTALRSRVPLPLFPLLGRPLYAYALDAANSAGAERVIAVVRPGDSAVQEALRPHCEIHPVSGDPATLADLALPVADDARLLVLPVEMPLLTPAELHELLAVIEVEGVGGCYLSGSIPQQGGVSLVAALHWEKAHPRHGVGAGTAPAPEAPRHHPTGLIVAREIPPADPDATLRVTDRVTAAAAARVLGRRIAERHMLAGVTIEDPDTAWIDATVRIGAETVIRPLTWLRGNTVIGEDCVIGPNADLTDCALGDRVTVLQAVLAASEVGSDSRIGPFAQLRPGCKVGRKVKIGNFVELKNTALDDGVSAGHLAYLGDAEIGERTNIGAGTITCNYDGQRKHRTTIGRRVFVGSGTTLIAPVELGDDSFTAAGTVVTQDVPADDLAIGRARQENKPGWAKRLRDRRAARG